MQQFQVPQYVDIEGKILGPLTLRQTAVVASAGGIVFLLRFILEPVLLIPVGIIIGILALALAFVKINGQPLGNFIVSFIGYLFLPRLYIWKKRGAKHEREVYKKKGDGTKKEKYVEPAREIIEEHLRAYAEHQDLPAGRQDTSK